MVNPLRLTQINVNYLSSTASYWQKLPSAGNGNRHCRVGFGKKATAGIPAKGNITAIRSIRKERRAEAKKYEDRQMLLCDKELLLMDKGKRSAC